MMNILIVEDELDKAASISRSLATIGSGLLCEQVTNSVAARRLMQSNRYDIVIIDLHLPAGLVDAPSSEGGFDFLDMLLLDPAVKLPIDFAFITAREELIVDARRKAAKRGAVLLEYKNPEQWQNYLIGRVEYVNRITHIEPQTVDIAIITALRDPELTAVLDLPYAWKSKRFPGDPVNYYFGTINREGASLSVVAASAHRKGMPSSAVLATRLVDRFLPKCVAMLGICAGIPSKTKLGDIVIADPTWDYGSGKRAVDENGSTVFFAAPYQANLDPGLRSLADSICNDEVAILGIRNGWRGDLPNGKLGAHIGPMASGSSVIADDAQARLIALQQREVLAIEMEAYAVMAIGEYAVSPRPKTLAIKSVCDFADSTKNDKWQEYSAYTSAQFADRLFRNPAFEV